MLAIFPKSIAARPDTLKHPHIESVSALKNGFLLNYFRQLYPHSDVTQFGDSAVFAYSHIPPGEQLCYQFRQELDSFCIFQGRLGDDLDYLAEKYSLNSEYDDEVSVIYQAFKILQKEKYQTPNHIIVNLYGDFSFFFYDDMTKLLFLTNGKPAGARLFWGLDADWSLVISDDMKLIVKACAGGGAPFPKDEVYVSRRGRAGLDALFSDCTSKVAEQQLNALAKDSSPTETKDKAIDPQLKPWQPPPCPDVFKINTQGVVCPIKKIIGIGVIIRNSRGELLLAGCKKIKGYDSELLAHELASVEGLLLALKAGFRKIIWESCCNDGVEYSVYQQVLRAYDELVGQKFGSLHNSRIAPSANKAASGLAEYAKEIEDCLVWVKEIPECIASVVKMESAESLNVTVPS